MRVAILFAGLLTLAALSTDTLTNCACAQQPLSAHLGYHQEHFGNMPWPYYYGCHGGYGYGGGYHHASTYEEGVLRGYADLIRSRGAYNLTTSLAHIKNEEARRLAIQNKLKGTETYFELRRINRQAREEAKGPRPSAEDIARYARERAPEPLEAGDFDAVTGRLDWPFALTTGSFAQERAAIDALVARRAAEGEEIDGQLRRQIENLQAKLKSQIRTFSTRQYLDAKNFLAGLKQTDTLPASTARLVTR